MKRNIPFRWLAACAVLFLSSAATGADELGRVSSVGGEATAQRPGETPRDLACGDPVFSDDTLRTGADSRLGVMLEDVMTHLDAETEVSLGRTEQAQPAARLARGKVRMLDPRDGGAPARLAALDASARVVGTDTEAYLFAEKVGPYAMLCEWDAPLPVERGDESLTADPGECVIAKPKEPLYTANAHDERIPALAEVCDLGPAVARLASPVHHLTPADVAAPGPVAGLGTAGLGGLNPASAASPTRQPCDSDAGTCIVPPPFVVFEPDPVTGCAPGVKGC